MGSRTGGRSYIAAGMFLFATLGFIIVQLDRQRKQRAQQVTGSRTEYLRYLANVRQVAREAADQQRRALTWHHPEPVRPPLARGGAVPGVGARQLRRQLPARQVRRLRAAAVPGAGPARERAHRPGRSGGRVGAAPAARRPPAAAEPPGQHRPEGLRPDRAVRSGGAGPGPGPGDALLGGGVPRSRAPGDRGAHDRAEPRALGLAEVAPARPERPAVGRRGAEPDDHHLAGRHRRTAAARPQRPSAVRRRGASGRPPHPAGHRRRPAAARQPRRPARRAARRHRARPADPLGRARGPHPACGSSSTPSRRRAARPAAGTRTARPR